jgi:hypothetical protein
LQDFRPIAQAMGRMRLADLLWRATLKRADELSRQHTASLGCRSLDVLHATNVIELELTHFVTFGVRPIHVRACPDRMVLHRNLPNPVPHQCCNPASAKETPTLLLT